MVSNVRFILLDIAIPSSHFGNINGQSLGAIEYDRDLLERIAFGLRVKEECSNSKHHKHHNEYDIVSPRNRSQRDRVDEGVEEHAADG